MNRNATGRRTRLMIATSMTVIFAACGAPAGTTPPTSPPPTVAATIPATTSAPETTMGHDLGEMTTSGEILLREHQIAGPEEGSQLYLRGKQQEGIADQGVVLLLEPFGVPSAEAFDVPGFSWMDDLAERGYVVWALDVRGFGRSTRPGEMQTPPMENPPLVSSAEALTDVAVAVDHLLEMHQVEKVDLIGWSWGAVLAAMYAAEHPDQVDRLVLHGGMHGFSLPSMTGPLEESPGVLKPLPGYQLATWDMTHHHWMMMMGDRPLADNATMHAVEQVFLASDPTSGDRDPVSVRRPMGPLVDLYHIWSDQPIFDASLIQAPVLVIRGDSDFFAEPGLAEKFTSSPDAREVVIPDATHWVIYETGGEQLFSITAAFLAGEPTPQG